MRMKSNNMYTHVTGSSHFEQSTSIQSWEEQAFAEDIRELGGFVWPPRCYSCSFCNRIFKSAQALGGHMNVHRRDRARLNQPLCLKTSSGADDKVCISDSSDVPSEVLAPFYAKTESVSIIQDDLGTKKVACMKHILMKESTVETDLSVGLNFYVPRNREAEHSDGCGDIKRRKMDGGAPVPLLYIACSASDKEIDLELRLGDSPTVASKVYT